MAKSKKVLIVVMVLTLLVSLVSACKQKFELHEEDVIGVWAGKHSYKGNEYYSVFTLTENGLHTEKKYKNGHIWQTYEGEYVIAYDDDVEKWCVKLYQNSEKGTASLYYWNEKEECFEGLSFDSKGNFVMLGKYEKIAES